MAVLRWLVGPALVIAVAIYLVRALDGASTVEALVAGIRALDDREFETAWILGAPGIRNHLSTRALEARRGWLQRDYDQVFRASPMTDINASINLYRPASDPRPGTPCETGLGTTGDEWND